MVGSLWLERSFDGEVNNLYRGSIGGFSLRPSKPSPERFDRSLVTQLVAATLKLNCRRVTVSFHGCGTKLTQEADLAALHQTSRPDHSTGVFRIIVADPVPNRPSWLVVGEPASQATRGRAPHCFRLIGVFR